MGWMATAMTARWTTATVAAALAVAAPAGAVSMGPTTLLPRSGGDGPRVVEMSSAGDALLGWDVGQSVRQRTSLWVRRGLRARSWRPLPVPRASDTGIMAGAINRHGDVALLMGLSGTGQSVVHRRGWKGRWVTVAPPEGVGQIALGDDRVIEVLARSVTTEPEAVGGYRVAFHPWVLERGTWRRTPGLDLRALEPGAADARIGSGGRMVAAWLPVGGNITAAVRPRRDAAFDAPSELAPGGTRGPAARFSLALGAGGTAAVGWERSENYSTTTGEEGVALRLAAGGAWITASALGEVDRTPPFLTVQGGGVTAVTQTRATGVSALRIGSEPLEARTVWPAGPQDELLRGAVVVGDALVLLRTRATRGIATPGEVVVTSWSGVGRSCPVADTESAGRLAAGGPAGVAVTRGRVRDKAVMVVRAVRSTGPPGRC